jgi:hypothetical protein
MKRTNLFAAVFFMLFVSNFILGETVYFTNPTNGQSFGCTSSGTANINVTFHATGLLSSYEYYLLYITPT